MKVWTVAGWDEEPRAIFDSYEAALAFAKEQDDYRVRPLNEDGTGHATYPFISEHVVRHINDHIQLEADDESPASGEVS